MWSDVLVICETDVLVICELMPLTIFLIHVKTQKIKFQHVRIYVSFLSSTYIYYVRINLYMAI